MTINNDNNHQQSTMTINNDNQQATINNDNQQATTMTIKHNQQATITVTMTIMTNNE